VARVRRREEERQRAEEALVAASLTDLSSLMERAADVVKLTGALAAALRGAGAGASREDAELMRRVVVDMGITSPVTREAAGGAFGAELAGELGQFLAGGRGPEGDRPGLLGQFGGIMPLTDVWYFFNRARGGDLVSPDDLAAACRALAAATGGSLATSEVGSGAVVVHTAEASPAAIRERLVALGSAGGDPPWGWGGAINPAGAAEKLRLPVALVSDILREAEREGALARDEGGPEGVVFYANHFPQFGAA